MVVHFLITTCTRKAEDERGERGRREGGKEGGRERREIYRG